MQDDLTIPSPTYRIPRHSRGIDPGTRKLAIIAAGIGCGLIVVAGGWHMIAHHHHGIPVVQAESGPLRVKPANPGGLQVAGVGNDIFSGGNDTNVEKLAPPPQTPDPQALQAMAPNPPPPVTTIAPTAATSGPTPGAGAAMQAPLAKAPDSRAAIAPPPDNHTRDPGRDAALIVPRAVDAPAPATAAAGGKPVNVQLAALPTELAAYQEWKRIAQRWPNLLDHRRPLVSRTVHDGHVFWRLRTGGFDNVRAASTFCAQLHAKGAACSVADF